MRQTIHFEDNLYFVNELINALNEGLNLKPDRQFFFDKIVEDIFFLDATINKLGASLSENSQFVQAQRLLRSLQITRRRFVDLLERILARNTGLEDAFKPFESKLSALIRSHNEEIRRIEETYLSPEDQSTPREGISPAEYQFLFPDEEEET